MGFSGGALLNEQGEIVGMITADEPPLGRAVPLALILGAARAAGYPVQISLPDDRASMPLHVAAKTGDVAAIRRLLQNCVDPNSADTLGRTALHEAAMQGSGDAIRLLLAGGARLHARAVIRAEDSDREWGTPLHLAAEHGKVEAVKALLSGDDADMKTLGRSHDDLAPLRANTALHLAAQFDRGDVAEVLIGAGADVEAIAPGNITAISVAIAHGSVGVARVLFDHGAVLPSPEDSRASTPLQQAAEGGNVEMLKLLIDHGADVNEIKPSMYESTALHVVVANGHLQAVAFLISQNAAVDARGYRGNTPLHTAAAKGSSAVVKLLLENGADANSRNEVRQTPIALAAARGDLEILQVLVNARADIGDLLHQVLMNGNTNAARILIEGGADVHLQTNGKQPLHVAVAMGLTEVVELLLKAGAPVNAMEVHGSRPLHLAAAEGHLAIVDLLIAAKASVNEYDRFEQTALHMALYKNHPVVVGRLLRSGADPNIESHTMIRERMPVSLAASTGPSDTLELLLAAGGDPNRNSRGSTPLRLALKEAKIVSPIMKRHIVIACNATLSP